MVMASQTWEEETRRTLSIIQAELKDAEMKAEEANNKVSELTKEVEAMELALEIHLKRSGKQETLKQDVRKVLAGFRNHEERIRFLASRNKGKIKVATATDILYNFDLIQSKSRMNAYRIVYGLIRKMVEEGIFYKTGAAEFCLSEYKTGMY